MLNNSIDSAICVTSDGAYIMWIFGEDRRLRSTSILAFIN